MIDYHVVKNWPFGALRQRYDQRDVMLYALGCGLGADPKMHVSSTSCTKKT